MPTVLSGMSGEMGSSTDHMIVVPLTSMCSTAPVVGIGTESSPGFSLARLCTCLTTLINVIISYDG